MANFKIFQRSFAGGEVSPELFGRIDDVKYATGLAKCRNFIPKPQGPVMNRPGFRFVREVKDSSKKVRLMPFTFSTTQTMVLEVGAGYFRFHTQGATLLTEQNIPYEIENPYQESELFDIHYVQSGDVVTFVHPNHPPKELRRHGATDWRFVDVDFGEKIGVPQELELTAGIVDHEKGDFDTSRSYGYTVVKTVDGVLYKSPTVWVSGNLNISGSYHKLVITDPERQSDTTYKIYRIENNVLYYYPRMGGDAAESAFISADPSLRSDYVSHRPTRTAQGETLLAQISATEYNDNAPKKEAEAYQSPFPTEKLTTKDNLKLNVSVHGNLKPKSTSQSYTYSYVVTAIDSQNNWESSPSEPKEIRTNLYLTGATIRLAWQAVEGASRYVVYKMQGGVYGFIGYSDRAEFVDDNIAPDLSRTPPRYENVFNKKGSYPSAVSYFEQRRCFAGTTQQPQNIWMTKSGTESNLSYSLPIRDDDRIAFRVTAREANTIRHIIPLEQLVLLTSSAEWRVTSVNSDAITPTSISVRPQSYIGANNTQPVIVNNALIYISARGGHVRELGYQYHDSGFSSGDISLRASHLFDGFDIVDLAYAHAPIPVVWAISTSGNLLGLTYIPEQQVGAWHQHHTHDGVFESCTVVTEGNEDRLYCVIKRRINGKIVRYIEQMEKLLQDQNPKRSFFVDSGLTYQGTRANVIGGLEHLEGCTVSILVNGNVHPQRVVENGRITLERASSFVHVGLPIVADFQTLPIAVQLDNAFGLGRVKNINRVWVRVNQSSGVWAGVDELNLREYKPRSTERLSHPVLAKTEELEIMTSPNWTQSGQVFIRQTEPLPLTVVSLTAEVSAGG